MLSKSFSFQFYVAGDAVELITVVGVLAYFGVVAVVVVTIWEGSY